MMDPNLNEWVKVLRMVIYNIDRAFSVSVING